MAPPHNFMPVPQFEKSTHSRSEDLILRTDARNPPETQLLSATLSAPFATPPTLNRNHREYLATRGVPADIALRLGWRSLNSYEIKRVLGWKRRINNEDGLGIWFEVPGDNYMCVRLDQPMKGMKFAYPAGRGTRPFIPPMLMETVAADVTLPLVIVEGPVKALALTVAGIPSISLAGSTGGGHDAALKREQKRIELHPVLKQYVSWKERRVFVMLDNDVATNKNVRGGQTLIATALEAAGAIVFLAPTPVLIVGEKLGPDDFLMKVGVERVREHLRTATRWVPPRPKRLNPFPSARFAPHRYKDIIQFLNSLSKNTRYGRKGLYHWYRSGFRGEVKPVSMTSFGKALHRLSGIKLTRSHGRRFVRCIGEVKLR